MHTSTYIQLENVERISIYYSFAGELLNTQLGGDREGRVKPKRRFSLRESSNKATRT